jgi:hypothetical protein
VCAFVSQTALDGDDESASFGLITATDGAQVAIYTSKNASFRSMFKLKLIDETAAAAFLFPELCCCGFR